MIVGEDMKTDTGPEVGIFSLALTVGKNLWFLGLVAIICSMATTYWFSTQIQIGDPAATPVAAWVIWVLSGISFLFWTLVAFAAHNVILSPGENSGLAALGFSNPGRLIRFTLTVSVFTGMMIVVGQLWITIFGGFTPENMSDASVAKLLTLWFSFLAIYILFFVIFCMFSTILPAIVDEGDKSFQAALDRKSLWPVLRQFIISVLVLSVFAFVIMLVMTASVGFLFTVEGRIVSAVIDTSVEFAITVLFATILSKAYLHGERMRGGG